MDLVALAQAEDGEPINVVLDSLDALSRRDATQRKAGTGSNFAAFAKLRACPRFAQLRIL
jgi:hypothetical protein